MNKSYNEQIVRVAVLLDAEGQERVIELHKIPKFVSLKEIKNTYHFMSKKAVLKEKQQKAFDIYQLFSPDTFVLDTRNIPDDMERILRGLAFGEYGCETYYDFLRKNVHKIIWCPGIYVGPEKIGVGGLSLPEYLDKFLYPGQSIFFFNSGYDRRHSGDICLWDGTPELVYGLIPTIMHEAAHKEAQRLVKEGKLNPFYRDYTEPAERYAYARELEFIDRLLQRPLSQLAKGALLNVRNNHVRKYLQDFNELFGLPGDNRELLLPITFTRP